MHFSFPELKVALRTFYFPILFILIVNMKDEVKKFIEIKYLLISISIYCSIIILGFITNTAFSSYEIAKVGTAGYFYAANEVGNIIAILLPFVFEYVFNKINYKKVLYFILIVAAIFILGTKTPFISLVICSLYYIFKEVNKKDIIKVSVMSLISLVFIFVVIPLTPLYKNVIIHASFLKLNNISELIEKPELFDHFVLGSRLQFLNSNAEIYLNSTINDKLLGIGYIENSKLAEMDFNDILFRQGIIGFIVYFGTIFYVFLNKLIYKKYILPITLIILISGIVGHVMTAPAVSTFAAYILCLAIKEVKNES
jgi:hypothetical protein